MWSPCSPDLNSLNFSVWSWLEKEACNKNHKSLEALKKFLIKAWVKMPQSYLRVTCESVRNRLERLIEAGGRHFE